MITSVPDVELKGATVPYTSVNGNMFSSISKANQIGIRLPKKEREEFIQKYKTTLFEALPGFFQKEYVAVPVSLLEEGRTLIKYFKLSYEYAAALKPKDTKSRQATKKKTAGKKKITRPTRGKIAKKKAAKKVKKAAKKKSAGKRN